MIYKKYVAAKFIELILVVIIIGLTHVSSYHYYIDYVLLTAGTYVGYAIIVSGQIIGLMVTAPLERNMDLILAGVGCILFIISGVLVIHRFGIDRPPDYAIGISAGVFAIITGFVFLCEAILWSKSEP